MKITAEKDQQSQYVVRIEVEDGELLEAKTKAAKRLGNRVRVPGFRPGKAPRALIERVVGQEALLEEATKDLLPKAMEQAMKDQEIKAIADPQVNIETISPLTIVATIPVEPTVTLGDYTSIRQPLEVKEVTDEDIQKVIGELREQHSTWEEPDEDRPAQDGDQVEIELITMREGELVGEPFNRTGVLGKGELYSQIDEQLVGMSLNETKVVTIDTGKKADADSDDETDEEAAVEDTADAEAATEAPENQADLPEVETLPLEDEDDNDAGKPITFQAKLNSLKVKHEPALDDAFAESVSDLKTLDELHERIRNNLAFQNEAAAKREVTEAVIKAAVEQSDVPVPPILIHTEVHAMENQLAERLKERKLSLDQYLSFVGKNHDMLHEELEPQAEERIKTALVMREIALKEGIAVSGDELDREVEKTVEYYLQNIDENERETQEASLRQVFSSKESREQLEQNVFGRKLEERLLEIATNGASASLTATDPETDEGGDISKEDEAEAKPAKSSRKKKAAATDPDEDSEDATMSENGANDQPDQPKAEETEAHDAKRTAKAKQVEKKADVIDTPPTEQTSGEVATDSRTKDGQ